MAEKYVQLPPDSSGTKIRLLKVIELQDDGTGPATTNQEVVTLADENGDLLTLEYGGKVPTYDETVVELLKAIVVRLDCLNAYMDRGYSPPDQIYEAV